MEHTVRIEIPEDADADEAGETVTLTVDEAEDILSVARESGLWLPADCQQGWCTTCATRILEGEVDQSDAKRYYDVDREADFVLLCVAQPRSEVRVEAYAQTAMLEHRAEHDLPPGRPKL